MMIKNLAKILLRISGWKLDIGIPLQDIPKCVLIAAPHTSNWDYYYTKLAFWAMDIPLRYFIKDSWTKPWYGFIIESLGGIGINREQKSNMVDYGSELLKTSNHLYLLNTPEASRSKVDKWKTGFYYIALKANVPIILAYADYENKTAGVKKIISVENRNIEDVFEDIELFYKNIKGKYPDNYNPKIF